MQQAIGILGGTFNPIHCGHLRAAIEVKELCRLSKVIMVPAFVPPHKAAHALETPADRLKMTELAIADLVDIECSDLEIKRQGTSYTIDTWDYFRQTVSKDTALYLILGLEVFLQIHTWHRFEELLQRAEFILTNRPVEEPETEEVRLNNYLNGTLKAFKPKFKTVFVPQITISSSAVRAKVNAGQNIQFLVPPAVAQFIYAKGLYQ